MKGAWNCSVLLIGLLFSIASYAAATVESISGNVRAGATTGTASDVTLNKRILPGSTVITGSGSRAVLRFDDGQIVVLAANTEFKISAYSFAQGSPASDNIVLELARGAFRAITGLLGRRNPQAFALRIPQATIGIRGTDFLVAVVNPAYVSVSNGAIAATNSAGTASFAAGTTGTIASSTTLAVAIPASALPGPVAATFSELSSLSLAAGASAATGAATGGVTVGGIAVGAAVAAGIAAAASDDSSTGTSGTTGTR